MPAGTAIPAAAYCVLYVPYNILEYRIATPTKSGATRRRRRRRRKEEKEEKEEKEAKEEKEEGRTISQI